MILRQQDFRRVTNQASRGQEVRDEARVRDRAPQTARSAHYRCKQCIVTMVISMYMNKQCLALSYFSESIKAIFNQQQDTVYFHFSGSY